MIPNQTTAQDRLRFSIDADGHVEGDDASQGSLAACLRYVSRMGAQMSDLTGLGDLQWINTWGSLALTARVGQPAVGTSIEAEVGDRPRRTVPAMGRHRAHGPSELSTKLQEIFAPLGLTWVAITSSDGRLVAATGHDLPAYDDLAAAGLRALAILGAFGEPYREDGVVLVLDGGSIVVADLAGHAVFGAADRFEAQAVAGLVDHVRNHVRPQAIEYGPDLGRL